MSEMFRWPSIDQFRNVVKLMRKKAEYKEEAPPTVTYEGTVKLHGTNAAVYVDKDTDELIVQSRSRIITPEDDNAGFAFFVHANKYMFRKQCEKVKVSEDSQAIIYGEWCGAGVNHGCSIHNVEEKFFVIFGVKQIIDEENKYYEPNEGFQHLSSNENRIFNICDFPMYSVSIDFSKSYEMIDTLIALTLEVEKECPVGLSFGHSGVGEGIVWKPVGGGYGSDYWFKVKGEKHAGVSKIKKLVEVDVEAMRNAEEFVEAVATEAHLLQGIAHLEEMNKPLDRTSTGDFLQWFMADVMKEEMDRIVASNLTPKIVGKPLSTKARLWFFEYLNKTC